MRQIKTHRLYLTLILTGILIAGGALAQRQQGAPPAVPAQNWETTYVSYDDDINLLARTVAAEAGGEPYEGQVAVAAVLLNRVASPEFPNSISGVVYEPWAFESVSNGLIWNVPYEHLAVATQAAYDALNGWDPSYGALFFWNPYKPVSGWIWTRPIVIQLGDHVFAL